LGQGETGPLSEKRNNNTEDEEKKGGPAEKDDKCVGFKECVLRRGTVKRRVLEEKKQCRTIGPRQ